MTIHRSVRACRSGFSLLEIMIVVLIIGILAAVVAPRFAGASEDARTTSLESSLGGVRAAISSFRAQAIIRGDDPFPTLAELTTSGAVLKFDLPENPFSGLSGVQSVSGAQANARSVVGTAVGWNYFVDNASDPPAAVFYANSSELTTSLDNAGDPRQANEL